MLKWAVMETIALEETPAVQSEPKAVVESSRAPEPGKTTRRLPLANILSFVVGLVGIAAIGAAAWVYVETQRDIARISTDIAQIRLSLELFGQQEPPADAAADGGDSLLNLSNRLAILEQNWRRSIFTDDAAVPASTPSPGFTPPPAPVATGGDCLPTGTRFMVAAGDSYAVCGTSGSVAVAAVDDGFITLGDGTVIAQGATVGLPGTQCMIGVVPSDGGGVSGYAEIRVVC